MPRKNPVSELQNEEEAAPSSPSLRRSSRLSVSAAAAPPPPTKVATRRNSAVESATVTPKATRTRRASAVQDVEPKELEVVKKAAAKTAAPSTPSRRGRKPSVSAAIIEEKTVTEEEDVAKEEPAKKVSKPVVSTPSRRGRKSIVPQVEEEPKKTPLRRGRKASTTETVEAEDPAPVVVADPKKTRSATSAKTTSEVKKPTTRRKSVTIEEPEKTDEPVSKVRKTAKQSIEETTEKTPVVRTRRSIVDKRVATPVKKSPNGSLLDPKSLEPITEKISPVKAQLALDDDKEEDAVEIQKDEKVEEEKVKEPAEKELAVKENEDEIAKKKEEEKPISDEKIPETEATNQDEKMEVEDIPENVVENSETPVEQKESEKLENKKEIQPEEKQEPVKSPTEETHQPKKEEAKEVIEPQTEKVSEETSEKTDDIFKKPSEVNESKITVVESTHKSINVSSSFDSFHLEISGSVLDSTSQENSEIDNKHITSETNESTPKNKSDSTDFELLDVSLVLKSTDYKKPPELPIPEVEKKLEITEKLNDQMAEFLEKEINQGKQVESEKIPQEHSKEEKAFDNKKETKKQEDFKNDKEEEKSSDNEKETKKQEDLENDKKEEKQTETEEFIDEKSVESPEMEPLELTEESKETTAEESFKEEDKSKDQNKSVELDETTDLIDDSQSESISESNKRKSIDVPIEESPTKKSKTLQELEIESKMSAEIQDIEEPMEVDSFIETEIINKSVTEPAQSVDLNKTAKETENKEETIDNSALNETIQDNDESVFVKEKSIIATKNAEDFLSLNKTIDHEEVIGNITLNQSTIIELPANTPAKKIVSSVQEKSAVEQIEKSISSEKPSLDVSVSKEKLQLDAEPLEIIPSPKKVSQELAKPVEDVKKEEVVEEKKKVIVEFIAEIPIELPEAPKVEPEAETSAEIPEKAAPEAKDESAQENITLEETVNGSLVDNEDSSEDEEDKDYKNFLKQSETELASSDESYQPENSAVLEETMEEEDDDEEEESFVAEHEVSIVSDSSDVSESKRVLRKSSMALSTRMIDANNKSENNSPGKKENKATPSKNPAIKKPIQEDINLKVATSEESKDEEKPSNKRSSKEKPSIVLQENTTESNTTSPTTESQQEITIEETINGSLLEDEENESSDDEEDKDYINFLKQSEKPIEAELASSDESYQPENSAVFDDTIEDEEYDEDEESFLTEHEISTVSDDSVFTEGKRVLRRESVAATKTISASERDNNSPSKKEKKGTPSKNPLIKKIIKEDVINLVTESEDDSTSNKKSSTEKPSIVLQENGTKTFQKMNEVESSGEKSEGSLDVSSDCAGKSTDSAPETPNEEIEEETQAKEVQIQANKGSKRRKLYHSGCYDLDKACAPTPVKLSEPAENTEEEVEVKATKSKKEPKVVEKENIEKVINNESKKSNVTAGKSGNKKKILKPSVEPPTTEWNVLPVPAIKPSTRNTVTPKKEKDDDK